MAKNKDIREGDNYLMHSRLGERKTMAIHNLLPLGDDALFEVNWNSLVRKTGYTKISIGDKTAVVDRSQLWSILFMLGSAEEQERLASPFMKQTRVTKFFKLIGVTASKDIQAGQMINVPLEFTLNPDTNEIVIGKGNLDKMSRSSLSDKSTLA